LKGLLIRIGLTYKARFSETRAACLEQGGGS
jgi:hypothetical protein